MSRSELKFFIDIFIVGHPVNVCTRCASLLLKPPYLRQCPKTPDSEWDLQLCGVQGGPRDTQTR